MYDSFMVDDDEGEEELVPGGEIDAEDAGYMGVDADVADAAYMDVGDDAFDDWDNEGPENENPNEEEMYDYEDFDDF
jgi:hypothetical protein